MSIMKRGKLRLAVSHLVTGDALPDPGRLEDLYTRNPTPLYPRPVDEIAAALGELTRLDVLEPGLVPAHDWRPDHASPDLPEAPALYTAVGHLNPLTAPPQPPEGLDTPRFRRAPEPPTR
jgi:hypothetical protein